MGVAGRTRASPASVRAGQGSPQTLDDSGLRLGRRSAAVGIEAIPEQSSGRDGGHRRRHSIASSATASSVESLGGLRSGGGAGGGRPGRVSSAGKDGRRDARAGAPAAVAAAAVAAAAAAAPSAGAGRGGGKGRFPAAAAVRAKGCAAVHPGRREPLQPGVAPAINGEGRQGPAAAGAAASAQALGPSHDAEFAARREARARCAPPPCDSLPLPCDSLPLPCDSLPLPVQVLSGKSTPVPLCVIVRVHACVSVAGLKPS